MDVLPGVKIDEKDRFKIELERRKPGQSKITTPRKEDDSVEILIRNISTTKLLDAPISLHILRIKIKRAVTTSIYPLIPSDLLMLIIHTFKKYGNRDHRGGGRSSARETANWVAAGAIAKQISSRILDIKINAYVSTSWKY